MKSQFFLLLSIFLFNKGFTQKSSEYVTVDIVKAKEEFSKEAMFFYEKNWKTFREEAYKLKHITGFELIKGNVDSTGWFTITLITVYKDSLSFAKAEANFAPIMKRISPNGPQMLNNIQRNQFLKYITGAEGIRLIGKSKNRKGKT
jgi:hypothetical protein